MELVYTNRFEIRPGYDYRHIPKEAGFWWDATNKVWYTTDPLKASKLKNYAGKSALSRLDSFFNVLEKSNSTESSIDITWPDGLKSYPFQDAGIEWSLSHPATLLADDMGLGKSIQAVGVINKTDAQKVLVICPASLKINWKRELEKWLLKSLRVSVVSSQSKWENADVYIINYDILKNFDSEIKSREWDVLVIDEVHYLKNYKAQRSQYVYGKWNRTAKDWDITPIRAKRKLALTGTPICNRPAELWPIVRYLCPKVFNNWERFHTRYANMHRTRWGLDISGASNLEELQVLLRSSCMIRRLKKQVLSELPDKIRQVVELPTDGDINLRELLKREKVAWNKYFNLKKASGDESIEKIFDEDLKDDVSEMVGIKESFEELSRVRHNLAVAKIPYVLEFIKYLEGKIIIFAHHRDVIQAIANELGNRAVKIVGGDSIEKRQAAIDRFQNDDSIQFFVGSIQASGVGITLTASSHVIFVEQSWESGSLNQAEDRAYRIGQKNGVLIQYLVFDESLDAHMIQTVLRKQEVIDKALDTSVDNFYIKKEEIIENPTKKSVVDKKVIQEDITNEQIELVHSGLRRLSGWCDGARKEDNVGFNKFDSQIGKEWAESFRLSKRMALAARKMLKKYHRQLGEDFISSLG